MSLNVTIIGGHGKIALRLAKILSTKSIGVTSVIRDASQASAIQSAGATPEVLSLEQSPSSAFADLFQRTNSKLVYFSAGAGGKGGAERTKAVDFDGAVKIFDAVEQVPLESRPYLVLVSGIDVRDESKVPSHYTEEDKKISKAMRAAIPDWVKWKYEAELNLLARPQSGSDSFKWCVIRPGGLLDDPATGKAAFGRTPLAKVTRDDVASALALFAESEERRDLAAGLHLDMVQGEGTDESDLEKALDEAIARKDNAWVG